MKKITADYIMLHGILSGTMPFYSYSKPFLSRHGLSDETQM